MKKSISNSLLKMSSKINTVQDALKNLEIISNILKKGGVIAVPTDTIYGFACLACNKKALKKIYQIKGRDESKPLAVTVGKSSDLEKWSKVTVSNEQLNKLLPGPVTLVFERKTSLPAELNPNKKTIGLRIPNHDFMIKLAKYLDEPIALTSANVSNCPSSLNIKEFESLWDNLDFIIDGGQLGEKCKEQNNNISDKSIKLAKAGSTVIDMTNQGTFNIIREGSEYERVLDLLENSCELSKQMN